MNDQEKKLKFKNTFHILKTVLPPVTLAVLRGLHLRRRKKKGKGREGEKRER